MPDQIHSYINEAGDPILFGSKSSSGVIVGNDGCSKFFIMGKLEVADPASLSQKLTALRHELLADPYFAGIESFKPERPKTAHGFHSNNDLPEVRYQVFKLLREMGINLRFHAVVADKMVIASREIKRRKEDPKDRPRMGHGAPIRHHRQRQRNHQRRQALGQRNHGQCQVSSGAVPAGSNGES